MVVLYLFHHGALLDEFDVSLRLIDQHGDIIGCTVILTESGDERGLDLLQHIEHILIIQVKGAPVHIRQISQLFDGDFVEALFEDTGLVGIDFEDSVRRLVVLSADLGPPHPAVFFFLCRRGGFHHGFSLLSQQFQGFLFDNLFQDVQCCLTND